MKGRRVDLALGAIALAFGSVSLAYPFGRDQGLFYYVGREWFLRGSIPYKDVFEQKTPFIFAIHGLLIALTGENMWAIRLADLVAIFFIGLFASKLVAKTEPTSYGTAGAAMLASSGFYYGYFSFDDTANCEIWCVLFTLGSIVAAKTIHPAPLACVIAGLSLGVGILAKPPTIWFTPFVLHALYARAPRGSFSFAQHARSLALFGAGVAFAVGGVLLYFQRQGALEAMIDVVLRANIHHAVHERLSLSDIGKRTALRVDWFSPYSYFFFAVTLGATSVGLRRGDRSMTRRYAFPLLLMIAAYGAIAMQLKFFDYYFGLMVLPAAVFGATVYDDVFRWAPVRKSLVPAIFAAGVVGVSAGMVPPDVWVEHARTAIDIVQIGRAHV